MSLDWPLGDSNPDALRHKILSLACLPIPPSGRLLVDFRRSLARSVSADALIGDGGFASPLLAKDVPHILAINLGFSITPWIGSQRVE